MIGKRIVARWVQGKGTDSEKHFAVAGVVAAANRDRYYEQWCLLVVDDDGFFHDVRADFARVVADQIPGPYR